MQTIKLNKDVGIPVLGNGKMARGRKKRYLLK